MEKNIDCSKYKNNSGKDCFRNSILAILQSLPIFSDHCIDHESFINFYQDIEDKNIINTVTYQIFKLFNLSLDNPSANLNPSSLTRVMVEKNPIWGEPSQQDSSEYFLDLLDGLKQEQGKSVKFIGGKNFSNKSKFSNIKTLEKIIIKQKEEEYCGEKYKFLTNMYSPFNKMFNFLIKNSKICPNCKFTNNLIESSSILKLDLPTNTLSEKLETLITNYMKLELLDEDNLFTCQSCIHKVKLGVKNKFVNLPKILVIHLKRFDMNSFGMFGRKKSNQIIYPLELDLTDIVNNGISYKYQLVSVNMHLGNSIHHGHYISMVKLATNNEWYIFNDESSVRHVNDINQLINNNAYILFYIRTD